MRRLLRWLMNGLCLLSLLACGGAGWLWWQGSRPGGAWAEVSVMHADLEVYCDQGGATVRLIRRWPGGAGAWAGGAWEQSAPVIALQPQRRLLSAGGLLCESGECVVYLRRDGTPERHLVIDWLASPSAGGPLSRPSPPLPSWTATAIPPQAPVILFALPPLLWLAIRSRRSYVRRRRRRLGLCLRCGYDLTGNTSGKCGECGTAVKAVRRVTP